MKVRKADLSVWDRQLLEMLPNVLQRIKAQGPRHPLAKRAETDPDAVRREFDALKKKRERDDHPPRGLIDALCRKYQIKDRKTLKAIAKKIDFPLPQRAKKK